MPNPDQLIDAAYQAIGRGQSDTDWKIAPTEHAELFVDAAPSLARSLRGARIEGLAEAYEESNAKAVRMRDEFKRTVRRADTAVFVTAGLGALLLITGGLQELLGGAGPWIIGTIGVLGVVSSGLATMGLTRVKGGGLPDRWAQLRAKAEAMRLAYFKAVMASAPPSPADQLLAFEYTRRFLLDNQLDYFRERGGQHEAASDSALNRSTNAVFLASTATAVAGLLAVVRPQFAVVAGLGVIASAYATLVSSRSAVNLDRVNADRYRAVADLIRQRKFDLDDYRHKIAEGEAGAVQQFFEPVFVALQADHKAFLNDGEQRALAIGDMEKRLDSAKDALSGRSAGDGG